MNSPSIDFNFNTDILANFAQLSERKYLHRMTEEKDKINLMGLFIHKTMRKQSAYSIFQSALGTVYSMAGRSFETFGRSSGITVALISLILFLSGYTGLSDSQIRDDALFHTMVCEAPYGNGYGFISYIYFMGIA